MAFFDRFFRRTPRPRAGTLLSAIPGNAGKGKPDATRVNAVRLARGGRGHCGLHEAAFILVVLWIALDGGWLNSDNVLVLPMVTIALYFLIRML